MDNSGAFPMLGLRRWPFRIVASRESASVWIGRPEVRERFERLSQGIDRIPNSQIVVLWASFGAGKTHAMMFLEDLLLNTQTTSPLYVVTPRGIKSFVDLYRVIVDAAIASGDVLRAGRSLLREDDRDFNDIEKALAQFASGNKELSQIASAWLRADRTSARDRSALDVISALDSTGAAIDALQRLVQVIGREGQRVVLLLDEVQELADLGKRLDECIGGFHKLFDSTPIGLTLVMSFTTASQGTVQSILGETLWDRVSQVIAVPALSPDEAADFLRELVLANTREDVNRPELFDDGALAAIIEHVSQSANGVTPRSVIKAADSVLRDALPRLEDGEVTCVDAQFVADVLHA